jgi:pantoate--beta-alanine ligase
MSALRLAPALDLPAQRLRAQPLVARTIADARALVAPHRRAGASIGLVPTMGALHDGHLSLIEAARRRCDFVAVSIFVNPKQFDEQSDLAAYPRQEQRDFRLAEEAGADLIFVPSAEEIYRPGFQTSVEVDGLTDTLEGEVRGAVHFRGVTTVVCKLFNIVCPHVAFFGQKDAQQAAVIRRMVSDLDIDVQVETRPTVREADGLALSSRNVRLHPDERSRALALVAALRAADALVAGGERAPQRLIAAAEAELAKRSLTPDYVALVDPDSFAPLHNLERVGLLLVAARVGQTRLIDNATLRVPQVDSQDGAREQGAPPALVRNPPKGGAISECNA